MNKALHTAAKTQVRRAGLGRVYYDRNLAEAKSTMEALRAPKRQLPTWSTVGCSSITGAGGPGWTDEHETGVRVTGLHP